MPRTARPMMRADGVPGQSTPLTNPQPNGRVPGGSDIASGLPYGEGGALRAAVANTPPAAGGAPDAPPPGVSPLAHAARHALAGYKPNVTPLFAPTQRPNESPMTGVAGPQGIGPTPPTALPQQPPASVSGMLSTIASATNSPTLRELADRANALGQ